MTNADADSSALLRNDKLKCRSLDCARDDSPFMGFAGSVVANTSFYFQSFPAYGELKLKMLRRVFVPETSCCLRPQFVGPPYAG